MPPIPAATFQEVLPLLLKYTQHDAQLPEHFPSISRLDEEVDSLEEILSQFNDHIQTQIITRRRRRNLLTHIHVLPAELLVQIFSFVAEADLTKVFTSLRTLASVSSYWFQTVLDTPTLWVHLNSSCDLTVTKCAIARSRQSMLHIHCDSSPTPNVERQFLNMVVPHVSRWATFRSTSGYTSEILDSMEMDSHPTRLEIFEVQPFINTDRDDRVPPTILQDSPSLKYLSIRSFSFPIESSVLSRLERIEFTPFVGGMPFTGTQWHRFLSNVADSPRLQDIKIIGRHFFEESVILIPEVFIPHRKTITLVELHPLLTGALLSSILIPPNQRFSISVIDTPSVPHPFSTMFHDTSPRNSLLSRLREGSRLEVEKSENTLLVKLIGSHAEFSVDIKHVRAHSIASNLFLLLPPSSIPNIMELVLDGDEIYGAGVFSEVYKFVNLERLILRNIGIETWSWNTDTRMEEICEALSARQRVEEGGEIEDWPCPKMQYFEIRDMNDVLPIWELLQRRYRNPVGASSRLPLPLKELRLIRSETPCFDVDPALIAEMKEYLGTQNATLLYD
ncbi:hypothetical protein FRC03_004706 [Tulasnella sp. 419]|nr:hypothetical protein FRC03_004706 [Tulasnella sp. 419]